MPADSMLSQDMQRGTAADGGQHEKSPGNQEAAVKERGCRTGAHLKEQYPTFFSPMQDIVANDASHRARRHAGTSRPCTVHLYSIELRVARENLRRRS